ncbi:hypothetical protein V6N13_099329 [Hibiscus sabdariffa]|uniref:Uncharacterized protein n=1 Tax=Hibiscus sabdariffa TaxID=183260 RepID=A0ABR2PZC4_9ROSI
MVTVAQGMRTPATGKIDQPKRIFDEEATETAKLKEQHTKKEKKNKLGNLIFDEERRDSIRFLLIQSVEFVNLDIIFFSRGTTQKNLCLLE